MDTPTSSSAVTLTLGKFPLPHPPKVVHHHHPVVIYAVRLTIGLCVGIPLVIFIIAGVVVTFCLCSKYQNRKMARMARIHSRHRRRAERSAVVQAPPQYTPTDPTKPSDSDLPVYSVSDPYAPPRATPPQLTSESITPPPPPSQHLPSEPSTDQANQQAAVVVNEDVPLLASSEEQEEVSLM